MSRFNIDSNIISKDGPLYFIADIGANHDGEINRAFKLIELAKEAGAHAAKFQNFTASKIVSKKGFENLGIQLSHQSKWEKTVYDTYADASISLNWTHKLKEKCDEVGITYFTSPYDHDSVDHVDKFVPAFKIGSGDISWHEILDYIGSKGKPVLLATGASTLDEVKVAMEVLNKHTEKIVLMQCNTNYTAEKENFKYINLNVLKTYKSNFPNVILGLSDHTHGHATVVGAVALGARVFEKHFTDDNNRLGPDHKFAMNPNSWSKMVNAANEVFLSLGNGEKKVEKNERETAILQRRGLTYKKDLPKGHELNYNDFFPLRPLNLKGITPYQSNEIIGKKLNRNVKNDDYVSWEDFE